MNRISWRIRQNPLFHGGARLCRRYLRWYHNLDYHHERNGERWVLERVGGAGDIGVVFDAGANAGDWSLMAAGLLPEADIYAFEIVPDTHAELVRRCGATPRIHCRSHGLADRDGTLPVHFHPSASGHATWTDYPHPWRPSARCAELPVRRGDCVMAELGLERVDFLKIDVEGAEHLVLEGLSGAFERRAIRLVQFEYGRVNILTHFLLADFYRFFQERGFRLGKIFPDFVDFRPYDLEDEDFLGPNYLACRADDPLYPVLAGPAGAVESP